VLTRVPIGQAGEKVRHCASRATLLLAGLAVLGGAPAALGQNTAPTGEAPGAPVSVNLNITPKRLVLDRGSRAGTVYIFNQGNAAATFDISLVERVMLPNGEIRAVAGAPADPAVQLSISRLASAQKMLVATPRRVTLAPGKGQTIRIRAMQPANGTGEHRTHLTVATVPPRETGLTAEQAQSAASGQLSFRITSVFGLSVPVIVRPGPVDARGAIENLRVATAEISPSGTAPGVSSPIVQFELRRLGANSLFGNVEVRAVRGRGRDVLGLARGVGVYPEIDRRTMQIPLKRALKPGEQIEIEFTDDDATPGRVIARSTLTAT
jgi:hypothetical protein